MGLTSSGPRCDVCDKYILPLLDGMGGEEKVNRFHAEGIKQDLMCHNKCKKIVLEAFGKKDWRLLPEGPLRQAYEDYEKAGGKIT